MPRGCGQNLAYPGVGSAAAPRGARSPEPRSPGLPAGCGARSAGCRGLRGCPNAEASTERSWQSCRCDRAPGATRGTAGSGVGRAGCETALQGRRGQRRQPAIPQTSRHGSSLRPRNLPVHRAASAVNSCLVTALAQLCPD